MLTNQNITRIGCIEIYRNRFIYIYSVFNKFYVEYHFGHSCETQCCVGYASVNGAIDGLQPELAEQCIKHIKNKLKEFRLPKEFKPDTVYECLAEIAHFIDREYNYWLGDHQDLLAMGFLPGEHISQPKEPYAEWDMLMIKGTVQVTSLHHKL